MITLETRRCVTLVRDGSENRIRRLTVKILRAGQSDASCRFGDSWGVLAAASREPVHRAHRSTS